MPRPDLRGCHVVVTRPREQSEGLIGWIRDLGGEALDFPVLAVTAADPTTATPPRPLASYDIAIFISANAVKHFACTDEAWPRSLRIAAVGAATARTLQEQGRSADLVPVTDFTSEGLLALPELDQVAGCRILIVRGEGGRETLGQVLRQRGASVDYVEVYRRSLPETDPSPLAAWLASDAVDFVVVTSGEGLQNLFLLMGDAWREALRRCRFVLFSDRVARLARDMGVEKPPIVTTIASDKGIIDAILNNFTPVDV